MKKIVFVSGRLGGGGSERVLTIVANQLKSKGYDVSIIAFGETAEPYENSCPVTILKFTNDFNQIASLRAAIKEIGADVVIAFEYYVGMKSVIAAFGMKNVKVIVSERNDPHKLDSKPIKKLLRNYLYSKADVLVCQTEDAKSYFSKKIQQHAVVICNPIKQNLPKWNAQQHKNIIVNFCKLEKQKNLPLLILAFSDVHKVHPEYALHIYGDGNEKENLMELISQNNLDEFIDIKPFAKNIHEIVSDCALFVSSSDYEGISNSMLEAMAMGMPIVCTDCPIGGARMVIQDGINGVLVPVNDREALAKAIIEVIDNTEHALQMANNAFKVNELYSIRTIMEQWCKIL